MVDMEVVVVLVMAMECDGAFMVTITTLVSCHSHSLTHSEEADGKRDSGGFTPPHNTIKWWLVGVAGVQAKWMMSAKRWTTHKVDEPHNTKHHTAKPVSFLPLTNPMPSNTHPCAISPHTLASSNVTTTPSATNNNKKEEGLMVAQKNKWTPPQKQGNTMGTFMADLV